MDRSLESAGGAGDAELLSAVARGDSKAFREIVRRHFTPVYRVAWRMSGGHADSEDITQEAFMKLWQNPKQVREAGALKGWLMRVAANGVIDRARQRRDDDLESAPEPADHRPLQDSALTKAEAARAVDAGIAALPERQRLALTLVYFEGLSNIEAAALMELSVDAVESLIARARRGLRESLSPRLLEELT